MRTTAHMLSSGREKEGDFSDTGATMPTLMLPAKDLRMRSIEHHPLVPLVDARKVDRSEFGGRGKKSAALDLCAFNRGHILNNCIRSHNLNK